MSDEAEQIRNFLNRQALPGPMDIPWANEAASFLTMAAELIDYQDRLIEELERERDEARAEAARLLDEIEEFDPAPLRTLPWQFREQEEG